MYTSHFYFISQIEESLQQEVEKKEEKNKELEAQLRLEKDQIEKVCFKYTRTK